MRSTFHLLSLSLSLALLLLPVLATSTATCRAPGASPMGPKTCPSALARRIRILNLSKITLRVAFVTTSGRLRHVRYLPPGYRFGRPACVGHRWMVRTMCGTCAEVYTVESRRGRGREGVQEFRYMGGKGSAAERCAGHRGEWTEKFEWPLIPAGLVNLLDGRVLGFASKKEDRFGRGEGPNGNNYTFAVIWDPKTQKFTEADLPGHNIFCPAMTLIEDGRLFVAGGGQNLDGYRVSLFDPKTEKWTREGDMNYRHWYGTGIDTGRARGVMVALGVISPNPNTVDTFMPELSSRYDFARPWRSLDNVDLDGRGPNVMNWYPHLHLMADGNVLMSGPQNDMYVIDVEGKGTITPAGKRNTQHEDRDAWGAFTIYYAKNSLLAVGGIDGWYMGGPVDKFYDRGHVVSIDMSPGRGVSTTPVANLNFNRSFVNLVNLPTGEVLAVGGNRAKRQWSDLNPEFHPERWNPVTNTWTAGAKASVPRSYHSTALLLKDGRVISAGGGLCLQDCDVNHPDHEIYSPPYLFNQGGSRAARPEIAAFDEVWRRGTTVRVRVRGALAGRIVRFTVVHHGSVTHAVSTDSRALRVVRDRRVGKKEVGRGVFEYALRVERNPYVMTGGWWFLFAVNEKGVPSEGQDIFVE